MNDASKADPEIVTERLIAAPRALVFAAWTDPAQVAQWWGPDGFTITTHEMDVRPGGHWRFVMHGPDGRDYQNHIVFVEIQAPERIVYDHLSTPKFLSIVTFVEEGGGTRLTLRAAFADPAAYEMAVKTFRAVEGARQTVGRLAAFVEEGAAAAPLELGPLAEVSLQERDGVHTLTFVRELPHPPETVWAALTDPAHLEQWSPFTPDRSLGAVGQATLTMVDGATVETFPSSVRRAVPPSLLEYTWDEDVLVWVLEATPRGTRLTLRHSMKDKSYLSSVSAGWHIALAVADRFLQGRPFGRVVGSRAKEHGWEKLNEAYAQALGIEKRPSSLQDA
jgi:uncharacterized protein YndB with AHSA1/START domain